MVEFAVVALVDHVSLLSIVTRKWYVRIANPTVPFAQNQDVCLALKDLS